MNNNEFPSNSKTPSGGEAKKIESVVASEVVSRKKSLGKRFKDIFIGGDSRSVVQYIITEVLVPQAKEMITEAASEGLQRMIYGEGRTGPRRYGARPNSSAGPTSYNRYSQRGNNPIGRSGREDRSNATLRSKDIDDIILATRIEADTVLERMVDLLTEYGTVSVADLHSLISWSSTHIDQKWGWEDLQGSNVQRAREGGYVLNLPKAQPLD